VNVFRPGQTLRRSDVFPQPTIEQNEEQFTPDLTEPEEEEQPPTNNQTSPDSEVVRRLKAELAQERAKRFALERASEVTSVNDTPATDRYVKEPRGLDITPWDGAPATLRPFITDILVEFSMRPRTYHNEDIKIKSIYGWLKNGSTPKLWAQGFISGELDPPFSSAAGFIDVIKGHFEDPNLLDTLSTKLNDLRQRTSVLALSGEFENLITQLGYGREVWGPMFYSKLKEEIKDGIALAGVNQRDYNSLRRAAIIIDNRAEQRRKEVNRRTPGVRTFGNQNTKPTATSTGNTPTPQTSAAPPSIATKEERKDRTLRRTPHPDPEREDLMRTGSCFSCKKPGHRAAECPSKTIYELDSASENDLPPPETR
jgi:hypothetical protein